MRRHLARKFAVFVVISVLLTQASRAQLLAQQEFPKSSRQKAAEELKKQQDKAADEAY